MGIRRWLSGTLRPDDVETDSITADSATVNGTTTTNTLEAEQRSITNLAAQAYQTSEQTVSNSTETKVQWDASEFEDTSVIDVDITNNKLIVQKAGLYLIMAKITFKNLPNDTFVLSSLNINGALVESNPNFYLGNQVQDTTHPVDAVERLSINDEIELFVDQRAGGDENTRAASQATNIKVVQLG